MVVLGRVSFSYERGTPALQLCLRRGAYMAVVLLLLLLLVLLLLLLITVSLFTDPVHVVPR